MDTGTWRYDVLSLVSLTYVTMFEWFASQFTPERSLVGGNLKRQKSNAFP